MEPSESKSKVKRNSQRQQFKGPRRKTKEERRFPLPGPLCGQVAASKRVHCNQDWSPAMAQENATNGQKDAKAADEIKYRETLLKNTHLRAAVVLCISSLQHPWQVTSTSTLTGSPFYKLGSISFVISLQRTCCP